MNNFKVKRKLFLSLVCFNSLLAETNYNLDDVVVSASGYEQNVKEAPASISVVTGEEILNRPMRDLGDIVQEVPGVSTSVGKTGSNTINIRGMASKYTLILIDGKRVNISSSFDSNGFDSTSGFLPPANMIERVEVIRGPASVIYGSDALGGVINIITKKNPDKATGGIGFDTRLQQHHNTWGNVYGLNGNIFAPIDEKISFNFRGKYYYGEKNKFYKRDIAGYDLSGQTQAGKNNPYTSHSPTGYKNFSVGGRVNYLLNERNSFYFDVDYGFQRLGSLNTSGNQITAIRDYHKYNFIFNHDGDYSELFGRINNYIQYSNTKRLSHRDVKIGTSSGTPNHEALIDDQFIALGSTWTKNFDFIKYGSMIFQAGPYFQWERLYKRNANFDKDAYQAALFSEGEYFINDYFSTTLGARLNYAQVYGAFLSPRFFVNTYPNDWLILKAGVANGLSIPDLGQKYDGYYNTSGTTDLYGNGSLKAETTLNYEISAIAENHLATVTLTGFLTDFSNAINSQTYQTSAQLPFGYGECGTYGGQTCSIYENVDKARSKGVEFSIKSKALLSTYIPKGIYLDFNYAFTDTKQRTGANKGKALNDVPRHNLAAKVSYKNWGFDSYLRLVSKIDTPTDNAHSANIGPGAFYKDMHLVDLGTNYHFKNGITMGVVINNLLDKNFVDYSVYEQRGRSSYTNNYQRMIPSRNVWLTLRADF
ncbi:TonB-dependent receptor [Campylobacter sp. MIT 21-1685]|uniref:TonB-dependent receptor domain-containing protein n=1 Tax=unclassified Campylobacter TaxID=2593542 RepID=UPI00224B4F98|nr:MULTISPECIES: TonB-dependent receptor [unclassified Campylobacter]MCX2682849.1 TonB-dependent receptor [Campylobacter sp. MIT 21-1684]MCX2751203.1 TonB-dependent receptor [Campylobacter sp. MIT 21-1682]MCX2807330.1 TonB-dependent receptor [Campylobacter sp. MIT 21-1685]